MRYVFIVNPAAGKRNAYEYVFPSICSFLETHHIPFTSYVTEKPNHATELARMESGKGDPVRIYAVGGDGTLNETAAGIVGRKNAELGIFPYGSGNDYIRIFGQPEVFMDPEKQIRGESKAVDIIQSDNDISMNFCSVGLDARVGFNMVRFRRLPGVSGAMAYNLSILKSLFGRIGETFEITIDGVKRYQGTYLLAFVGNGRYYGGGYCGAPLAIPDDGLLDFVLIKKPALYRIPALLRLYKQGLHLHSDQFKDILTFCRGKHIKITAPDSSIANFDGECHVMSQIHIQVLPKAVNFIVPV